MSDQIELLFVEKCCCRCRDENIEVTKVEGKLWCNKCLLENYFICSGCNSFKLRKSRHSVRSINDCYSKVVGDQCFDEQYTTCKVMCDQCFDEQYTTCQHCNRGYKKSTVHKYENHIYCRSCCNSMFECVACRRRCFPEQFMSGGLCRYCYDDECITINPDHHARAPQDFQGKGPHYYGIELEVEVDDRIERRASIAKKILGIFNGFVITKHDGSLIDVNGKNTGFEIVTVPASRKVQYEKWNLFFDNLPKGLRSYDTKTCGLHIHCSRKPLSMLTIAKMLLFINNPENAKFIQTIAGRSANRFCQIHSKCLKDVRRAGDRYEALNLVNKGTVEFRIFRGTLKRESLFKSIEFCDALLHYCMECFCNFSDSKRVDKFLDYVKLHKKDYLHLWAFLTARWYGTETDLTRKMGFPLPNKPAEVESYNNEPNPEIRQNTDDGPNYGALEGNDDFWGPDLDNDGN